MRHTLVSASAIASSLFAFPFSAQATDYYVSATGNDANTGSSAATAWRTLAKVNTRALGAGDRVLLEGGATFTGPLNLDAGDVGTAASPITITSYGAGRATISAGSGNAIYAYNTAGVAIVGLNLVGSGASINTQHGVLFYADRTGNVKLPYVRVTDVSVSGFRNGIVLGSWSGSTGYTDVVITRADVHSNQRQGIFTYGAALGSHTNVTVSYVRAYNNLGDPTIATNSGNGIVLAEVDGGLIERCVAWNNGASSAPGYGPVAIWAYNSNAVTIQYCEAYANRTSGTTDGGGFDLDINMTNSVMQYNYSHDNDGAGYGLYQGGGTVPWSNNVVRYNISQNDGRRNSYGAITVWGDGGPFSGCDIYGNTVYVSPSASGSPRGVRFNSASSNFRFFNNVFYVTGGLRLVDVVAGQSGIVFVGNDYWTSGGAFAIAWSGTVHSSLSAWSSATSQERVGGTLVGRNVDPLLTAPGTGGTLGNADLLDTLTAYRILASSPMVDTGLDLVARYGINPGPNDYYESALPQGSAYDVGAHELASNGGPVNQAPSVTSVSASPNPTSGTTSTFAATATDDAGEPALTYTWSLVSAPAGGGASFSANATNAARNTVATFTRAGAYTLRVTARDAQGLTAFGDASVTVNAVATAVAVSPTSATIKRRAQRQYAASVRDQFGVALSTQPAVTWSVTGPNTISATGLATAGTTVGTYTVSAVSGGRTGSATLTVRR